MHCSQLRQIKIHAPARDACLMQVFHQQAQRATDVQSIAHTERPDDPCNAAIKHIAGLPIHPDELRVLVSLPVELNIFHGTIVQPIPTSRF